MQDESAEPGKHIEVPMHGKADRCDVDASAAYDPAVEQVSGPSPAEYDNAFPHSAPLLESAEWQPDQEVLDEGRRLVGTP